MLLYEYVGFVLGYVPVMTKGVFARHFGGPDVVNQLTDDKPSKTSLIFLLLSLSFQILLWFYKRFKMMKFKKVLSYVDTLRQTLVDNVYNVFGFMILISVSCVCFFIVANHRDNMSKEENENEMVGTVPGTFFYMLGLCTVCCLLPYAKSHALR